MSNNKKLKIIIIIFIIIFSNFFSTSIVETKNIELINEDSFYGYIIPLPSGKDNTYETFENSKVRFLINDLLRENIDVFWTLDQLSASCNSLFTNESNNDLNTNTLSELLNKKCVINIIPSS